MKKIQSLIVFVIILMALPTISLGSVFPYCDDKEVALMIKSTFTKSEIIDMCSKKISKGEYQITFTCTHKCNGVFKHTMYIRSIDRFGNFSGYGHYNQDRRHSWDIEGKIVGPKISFKMIYTDKNKGYTVTTSKESGKAYSSEKQWFKWKMY